MLRGEEIPDIFFTAQLPTMGKRILLIDIMVAYDQRNNLIVLLSEQCS